MTTKAMPCSAGRALNRRSSAGKPPADAPIPTTGKFRPLRAGNPGVSLAATTGGLPVFIFFGLENDSAV